ncbi:MAG: methionyl-tRNA formyltransferase [Hyphomicrobiaceae bacterium]
MRVIFMGTPAFSVPTLSEIISAGHNVVAVYTQPPRPAGRGMAETKSPVHLEAESAGIAISTPKSLRGTDVQRAFAAHGADVAVVVAYGLILPKPILDAPRFGCLNLHASALPRWRGAAPIQRAVMAGDHETAAMVMRMDEGLDTGPVCLAQRVPIGPDMTAGDLHDRLSIEGADLIVRALAALERGSLTFTPQAETGVTYAAKIDKAEAEIRFDRPAAEVHNHIRGLSPFPGAWCSFESENAETNSAPERLKVLRSEVLGDREAHGLFADNRPLPEPGTVLDDRLAVACREGAVRLLTIQRAGKKPLRAEELLRGLRLRSGARLGSAAR